MSCRWISAVVLGFACCASPLAAQESWPQFRGPDGRATAPDARLDAQFASKDLLWKTALPGPGASSPVVAAGRVFLTSYSGYGLDPQDPGEMDQLRLHVVCLDARRGRLLWERTLPPQLPEQPYRGFITRHGYAANTPVVDGDRVYVHLGRAGLFAFDFEGNQLWHAPLGTKRHNWGSAASPVVYQDLVIVNASVEDGSLQAFDKRTGRRVWRTPGVRRCWGSPMLVTTAQGEVELVISMQGAIWGLDPGTGEKLWQCRGIQDYVCPTPAVEGDVIYAIGGRRSQCLAVRAGGRGDVTQTHLLWEARVGANVPSPVVYRGHLYWVNDRGQAICVRTRDGQVVYQRRVGRGRNVVYASTVRAGDKLLAVARSGNVFVLAARPEYELLGRNTLEDESVFNATPAVAQGRLYLRSDRTLYCFKAR